MCFGGVDKAKINKRSGLTSAPTRKASTVSMKDVGKVSYTPINKSSVPNLVGGSTYEYIKNMNPTGFNAGGFSSSFNNGTVSLNTSPERQALVSGVQGQYQNQADELMALKGTVAPGMSAFRQSALSRLEDARKAAISNLRENFARRGILGSSFGEDAIARQDMEYQREAERISTESYLKEVELTNNLLNQQYEAGVNAFQTGLNELNIGAELGAKLASDANQWFTDVNKILGTMAMQDSSVRSNLAAIDAQNKLKASITNLEARLAVAQGNQRSEIERQLADAQYQLQRASIRQSANNADAQIQQDTLGGIGQLAGTVLTAPIGGVGGAAAGATVGGSLFDKLLG